MQILSKYLKRLFLFLIPLFVFTNQNLFQSKCIENSTYDDKYNIFEKLNETCSENEILCPMSKAIAQVFKSTNTYSETYSKNISNISNTAFKYENVGGTKIICKNTSGDIDDNNENYIFTFDNCTIFTVGNLREFTLDETEENFINEFYASFYINSIKFNLNTAPGENEMEVSFDNSSEIEFFQYNCTPFVNYSYFDDFVEVMRNISKNYKEKLINIVKMNKDQLDKQKKYLNEFIMRFNSEVSIINEKQLEKYYITYVAFNELNYTSLIHILDAIYIVNLTVQFEYALNYNITYQEGSITFDNYYINKNARKKYNESYIYVGDKTNFYLDCDEKIWKNKNSNIWTMIKNEFESVSNNIFNSIKK